MGEAQNFRISEGGITPQPSHHEVNSRFSDKKSYWEQFNVDRNLKMMTLHNAAMLLWRSYDQFPIASIHHRTKSSCCSDRNRPLRRMDEFLMLAQLTHGNNARIDPNLAKDRFTSKLRVIVADLLLGAYWNGTKDFMDISALNCDTQLKGCILILSQILFLLFASEYYRRIFFKKLYLVSSLYPKIWSKEVCSKITLLM